MEPTQTESWRPIAGYEDAYEVSDLGRVRSVPRVVNAGPPPGKRAIPAKVLTPTLANNGYLQVTLRRRALMIHSLVAEAFIGPRPDGLETCHNDGDSHNNRLSNLRYDTISSNRKDTVLHGRNMWANRTHCPQGHPYDDTNTGKHHNGRRCLTCHRIRESARYHSRKAAPCPTPTT